MWTLPVEAAPLLWDSSINEDTSKGGVLRDSINKACQGPLPATQSEVGEQWWSLFYYGPAALRRVGV